MSPIPEDESFVLPRNFICPPRPGPITDAVGMEFRLLEQDPALRSRLIVLRYETMAAVYRLLADEAAKAAEIHAEGAVG